MNYPFIKVYPEALSAEFCEAMLLRFQADERTQPDPQPDYSRRHYLNLSLCSDWLGPIAELLDKTNQLAENFFARPEGMESVTVEDWIDDGFIMSHYKKGDDLVLHVDNQVSEEGCNGLRLATVVFFLSDCEGGALHFPLQQLKIPAVQGSAVVFPPDYSHPHEVLEVLTDRFIVQTWLTDPELKVVPTSI